MPAIAGAQRVFAAAIRKYGSRATAYERGAATQAADGSDTATWQAVATTQPGFDLLLFPVSVAAAQKLWGVQTEARYRGFALDALGLAARHGVTITAKAYLGKRFLIVEPPTHAPAGVIELGLMETTEEFT